MPRGKQIQEWHIALCTVCLSRKIKKRIESEIDRVADKNGWLREYSSIAQSETYICPNCRKEGYAFE